MNKTHLIVSGVSVASVAAGAAGGYLFAKKRFEDELKVVIQREVAAAERYYDKKIAALEKVVDNAEYGQESDVEVVDAVSAYPDGDLELEGKDFDIDQAVVEQNGQAALKNYQSYSKVFEAEKPPLEQVVKNNIFTDSVTPPKKATPPRGPGGKFLPRQAVSETSTPAPYPINDEHFLLNDPEFDQESLYYFVKNNALIVIADNETVEVEDVGEENLLAFPDGHPSVIYIRNEKKEMDYQITKTMTDLTEYMGLGDGTEEDIPDNDDDEDELAEELLDQD